jgi:hypothetical protein
MLALPSLALNIEYWVVVICVRSKCGPMSNETHAVTNVHVVVTASLTVTRLETSHQQNVRFVVKFYKTLTRLLITLHAHGIRPRT